MNHPDALRWNARYLEEGARLQERLPRRLLLDFTDLLPDHGLALDAASGVSVEGIYLASRGWKVIALDISEVALGLARAHANKRGTPLHAAVYDLSNAWLPARHFEVIMNFRFLERTSLPVYRAALKPGGLLFFEAFVKTTAGESNPDYYLDPGELTRAFQGFEVLHSAMSSVTDGDGQRVRITEQFVARKPPGQPLSASSGLGLDTIS